MEFYLHYKDKKLTMGAMWIFNAKLYFWMLLVFISIILLYYLLVGIEAASIVAAALVGVLLRDIGTFRKSVRNWPLLNEIIDWDKAAALMEKNQAAASVPRTSP